MKLTDHVYYYPEHGMIDCNTYVIKDEVTVLIDPGFEQQLPTLIREMERDGIDHTQINIIAITHLHADHYWASDAIRKTSGARILMHPLQKQFYDLTVVQVSKVFGMSPVHLVEDGLLDTTLNTGSLEFEFLSAPGHSPDSICYYCEETGLMICGDVVFAGNTGRVDFPGGNGNQLKQSIEGLSALSIEYLLPGHMGIVAGKDKVNQNFKFVREHVFPWL